MIRAMKKLYSPRHLSFKDYKANIHRNKANKMMGPRFIARHSSTDSLSPGRLGLSKAPANRTAAEIIAMTHNLDECFEFTLDLVKIAGKVLQEGFNGLKIVETKLGPWDLVTEYDKRIESILKTGLAEKFPTHKFIGEETASETNAKPELTDAPTWIVDPIDGTNNFVHGLQITCISIGLAVNKEVVIGIIYNPILEQLFTARKGQGAFYNGNKIQTSNTKDIANSVLCVEISFARIPEIRQKVLKRIEACVSVAQGIRSLGCAAMTLSYVAMGAMDGFHIDGLACWDVAAGSLILTEAGGTVLSTNGGPFDLMSKKILCAASKELAEEMAAILVKADASLLKSV